MTIYDAIDFLQTRADFDPDANTYFFDTRAEYFEAKAWLEEHADSTFSSLLDGSAPYKGEYTIADFGEESLAIRVG